MRRIQCWCAGDGAGSHSEFDGINSQNCPLCISQHADLRCYLVAGRTSAVRVTTRPADPSPRGALMRSLLARLHTAAVLAESASFARPDHSHSQ